MSTFSSYFLPVLFQNYCVFEVSDMLSIVKYMSFANVYAEEYRVRLKIKDITDRKDLRNERVIIFLFEISKEKV